MGRAAPLRPHRDAGRAIEGRPAAAALGALIGTRTGVPAAALLLALVPAARAQSDARPALQLSAFAGVLQVDDDFALAAPSQRSTVLGGRVGWRPAPQVTLAAEAWVGRLDRETGGTAEEADGSLRGVGGFATFRPWTERGWPADPAFDFGLEAIDAGDAEDRSPAFVFGVGAVRRVGGRGRIEIAARSHFLTVDEDEVDGVATGRDAELWEIRAGASLLLGGGP